MMLLAAVGQIVLNSYNCTNVELKCGTITTAGDADYSYNCTNVELKYLQHLRGVCKGVLL